jgi:hypothetical protein
MNLFHAIGIIVLAVALTVTVMLVVRRFAAPPGGFFTDADRAGAVFSVAGTGFAVLLAFVIFLSYASYDRAREKASTEAVAITELYETARLFAPVTRRQLHGELICYARAVVRDEWKAMRDGHESPVVDGWVARIENTADAIQLNGEKHRVAYDAWFQQTAQRREGRRGRLAEAKPLVPSLVWLALILGGVLIISYMCLYADPSEPALVQAGMMATVTTMVVAGLLVVRFLDRPYEGKSGSIEPTAMTLTLRGMDDARKTLGLGAAELCDEDGRPRA